MAIYNVHLYYNLQFTMQNTVVFFMTLCNHSLCWSPLVEDMWLIVQSVLHAMIYPMDNCVNANEKCTHC